MANLTQANTDLGLVFLKPEPQTSVMLQCGDKTFIFNKAILTQHSEYFAASLKETTCIEGETSTLEFNDIEPEHLDAYLQFAYCRSVSESLLQERIDAFAEHQKLVFLVKVWQVADRFQSSVLCTTLGAQIAVLGSEREFSNQNDRAWWISNVKSAFAAFDEHAANQVKIRDQMMKKFIHDFPSEHLHSALGLADLSAEFIRELWKALAVHACDLEKRLLNSQHNSQQRISVLEKHIGEWRDRVEELEEKLDEHGIDY